MPLPDKNIAVGQLRRWCDDDQTGNFLVVGKITDGFRAAMWTIMDKDGIRGGFSTVTVEYESEVLDETG